MDEDWRNAFGILMCAEICDGPGPGICDGMPSTRCSEKLLWVGRNKNENMKKACSIKLNNFQTKIRIKMQYFSPNFDG